MPRKAKPREKATVDVDTGTLMIIDPGYLFSGDDWQKDVIACAYPSKKQRKKKNGVSTGSYKECLRRAIEKQRGATTGDFAVVGTGGDGGFPVRCKGDDLVIKPYVCHLEK
jgi:hypothetical protein